MLDAWLDTNKRGGRGIMGIPYSRVAYRLVMGGDKREAERLDWGIWVLFSVRVGGC
jgi:hypothetical protein